MLINVNILSVGAYYDIVKEIGLGEVTIICVEY